ncbi:hypothetical protein [Bradyrhizobium sp. USDA 3364]
MLLVLGAAQGRRQRGAVDRLAGIDRTVKDELLIVARYRLADDLDRERGQRLLDDPALLDPLGGNAKLRHLAVEAN